jgi:hypothetical protein
MSPILELMALTGLPFLIGIVIGYGVRSYVSMVRRSKLQ